ncbi:MAG: CesT family type III secretion system chaperone [Leptospiraceae bacterium]|nr:CesT family type III secretion system chaperone [Leptospiraceae bacterium]
MERFETVLKELGNLIDLSLYPNNLRCCYLNVNHSLIVELKESDNKEMLRLLTFVSEVPPGKFREMIFLETLKENFSLPRKFIFSYVTKNNQLAIGSYLYFNGLTGSGLADFLERFLEKAFSWKTAISTGKIPLREQNISRKAPSIFDVKK